MATILPPLTPVQMLAVYRERYPEGLVCTGCGRLLSTRWPGKLTEAERLAYVCAECRWDRAEAERVAASKSERGRKGAEAARQARQAGPCETVTLAPSEADHGGEYIPKLSAAGGSSKIQRLPSSKSDAEPERPLAHRRRRGGWKPGESRQARYRRRHPHRAAADLRRLRVVAALTPVPASDTLTPA